MALYEATFIARQDMTEKEVERLTEEFSGAVTEKGGRIVKNESWGLRNLAYRINKNRKGHYVMLGLDAPAEAVKEIRRKFNLSEDVIRSLVVRVDNLPKGPSAMLQQAVGAE